MFQQQEKPLDMEKLIENKKTVYKKNYKPKYKKHLEIEPHIQGNIENQKHLIESSIESCKDHDYIRIHGITTCSKCPFKSIKYLTPLKKLTIKELHNEELPVITKTKKKYYKNYKNKPN
jgi:hypothetical protein